MTLPIGPARHSG